MTTCLPQVHDSLAQAPPDNIHMLTKITVDSHDSEDSAHVITGSRSSPTKAADGGAGADGAGKTKAGYSDLDHAAKFGYGVQAQLPRPAKSSKHSRHWAGSKNIMDYFVLRALPGPVSCFLHAPSASLPWMSDL